MDFSDNPFFWSSPSVRPTTFRGFPSYSPEPQVRHRKQPEKMSSAAPRVVDIPVHFVSPEPSRSPSRSRSRSRSASALKIQKVFRGFMVRRSMKRIIAIRRDVDEIERSISQSETLELIRRDERERLRVNEALMALLFKLDSVRGVDSGVRDCRRAVIKKAIALQERIDAIASAVDQCEIEIVGESNDDGQGDAEGVAQTLETTASDVQSSVECAGQIDESTVVNFDHGSQESSEGKEAGQGEVLGDVQDSENLVADNCEGVEEENRPQESVERETADGICEVKDSGDHSEMKVEEIREVKESGDHSEMKVEDEKCMDNELADSCVMAEANLGTRDEEEKQCVEKETGESCQNTLSADECMEESPETSQMETLTEGGGEANDVSVNHVEGVGKKEKERTDDNKRNQELLERMMADNQKMMNMMSQLCERNEMQMRMLNSLTHRVEKLEQAFICQRLRRKKCRNPA